MRMVMLILLVLPMLLGMPAQAADPELDKFWVLFINLRHSPNQAPAELEAAGVSAEGATALARYAIQGMNDLDRLAKEQLEQRCARVAALKASRVELADTLQRDDEVWNAARANLVANIRLVLSVEDERNLRDWISQQRAPTAFTDSGHGLAMIRSGEIDHVASLNRTCGGGR